MSSILKALEKAEETSSTKRLGAEHDIIRTRKSRPVWILPTAVLSGAAVAALVTFAAMGGFSRRAVPAPAQVAVAPAAPTVPAAPVVPAPAKPVAAPVAAAPAGKAAPAQVAPVTSAPAAPAAASAAPVLKSAKVSAAKAAPKAKSASAVKTASTAKKEQRSSDRTVKAARPEAKSRTAVVAKRPASIQAAPVAPPAPAVPAAVAATAAAPAHAEPKVSGIAWQNNGESSFAVVNGRAVLQGGMVDGYKVLEIRPDRVRFSGNNGTFDVPVGEEK